MIPIKKEETIRQLIHDGHSNNHISTATVCGHATVQKIRKSITLAESHSIEIRERVIFMLIGGFPIEAVVIKLGIPAEDIGAMHRYYYLHSLRVNQKSRVPICSICRRNIDAMCEPPPENQKNETEITKLLPHAAAMYEIACHVRSLDDLGVIASPLFCGIASLVRETLEKINGIEEKTSSGL